MPSTHRVEFRSSFGVWEEAIAAKFGLNHTNVIEELEPNATYVFRVAGGGHDQADAK
jgi:hypothetical protein